MTKKKIMIICISTLVILTVGISIVFAINRKDKNNLIYKESPYTLDEIYEIIEDGKLYKQNTKIPNSDFSYVLLHFYDYFNKDTKFKIVTKCAVNEDGYKEVLETKLIDYYEFMKKSEAALEIEKKELDYCKTEMDISDPKKCSEELPIDYRDYVESIVFNSICEERK